MFYLETKDGDKFFTNKDSDDKLEFEKIIEAKLGRDSANLFTNLIADSEENAQSYLNSFSHRFKECITKFDDTLNHTPVDTVALEEILSDLQQIYSEFLR